MKFKKLIMAILFIVLLILGSEYVVKNIMFPYKHQKYVDKYSEEYNVDPLLVLAIMKTESNFNSDAESNKGAKGLMQIMDSTAEWISEETDTENFVVSNIYNEEINIKFGSWYINNLLNQFETLEVAIAAYNAGSGNVTKWLADKEYSEDGKTLSYIPFVETKKYVDKVITNYNIYKTIYK